MTGINGYLWIPSYPLTYGKCGKRKTEDGREEVREMAYKPMEMTNCPLLGWMFLLPEYLSPPTSHVSTFLRFYDGIVS